MSNIYFCLVNVSEVFSRIRNICIYNLSWHLSCPITREKAQQTFFANRLVFRWTCLCSPLEVFYFIHMNTVIFSVWLIFTPVRKVNRLSTDPLKCAVCAVCAVLTVETIPTPSFSHESLQKFLLINIIDSYKIGLFRFTVGLGISKCFTLHITEITAPIIIWPVLFAASICNTM